jgi:predicted PurR-regulated permease PerM
MIVRKRITLLFLLAVTALSLYLCYIIFRPFLYPLLSAVVIAIVFFPLHARMARLVRNSSLAALLSTILVTVIIIIPAVFVGVAISQEISHLIDHLDAKSSESGGLSPYLMHLLERPMAWLGQYVDLSRFNLRSWLLSRLQAISSFLLAEAGAVLGSVTSFIVNSVIALFTLFFLFREGRSIRRRAAAVLPLNAQQVEELFNGIGNTIIATVYGGVVVAAAQGALTGIALWICGVPSPVLWGVVAAGFSLVPLVGSAVVWLPAAIYLAATGHWGCAIFIVVWGAAVVGTADNFLRPILISGRVKMHTLLIFFAVFGGVQVFGFIGLFVGPVILAVTMTLLGLLKQEAGRWRSFWAVQPDPETPQLEAAAVLDGAALPSSALDVDSDQQAPAGKDHLA